MRHRERANLLSSYCGHRAFQATPARKKISADLDGKEGATYREIHRVGFWYIEPFVV